MQIMKGYHCSSDSVNLRALHSVSVCAYLLVCMPYAAYVDTSGGVWRSWCSAVDSHPTSETT